VSDEPATAKYLRSLHFAVALFHGEQLIHPENLWETAFVSGALYLIFVGNAWLVSTITTAMTHLEILSTRRTAMVSALDRWLFDNNVSYELAVKVQRSAKKCLEEEERNLPEANIALLQMISDPLRMELHFEIHSAIMFQHPFFLSYNHVNPGAIKNVCHTSVSSLKVAAEDVVFSEMEQPANPRIFFVIDGVLKYSKPSQSEDEIREVKSGVWIGEALLWTEDWLHVGTLTAVTDSQLLAVEVKGMHDHIANFGTSHARHFAKLFTDNLNALASQDLSDIGNYNAELGQLMLKVFGKDWLLVRNQEQAKIDYEAAAARSQTPLGRISAKVAATPSGNAMMNTGRRISDSSRRISDTVARRISGRRDSRVSQTSGEISMMSSQLDERRASGDTLGSLRRNSQSSSEHSKSSKNQVLPIEPADKDFLSD